MTPRQRIVALAPVALIVTMAITYRLLVQWLGPATTWYVGFLPYWLLWCLLFPLIILRREEFRSLYRFRRPGAWTVALFLTVIAFTLIHRLGLDQHPYESGLLLFLIPQTLVNAVMEETLWRGVYLKVFPQSYLWGIAWPTLGFALWHFVPGLTAPNGDALTLVIGAAIFGLVLAAMTRLTGSIFWSALTHFCAAVLEVIRF